MQAAIVQMPGLNRDRDMIQALKTITGKTPLCLWQSETMLPKVDVVFIPGGFSYGDYLRCGAIAARMPILRVIKEEAQKGLKVVGICNGFQILLEAGLLPGALMRNKSLRFVSRLVKLRVANAQTAFTHLYKHNEEIVCPIAHHDGNYFAEPDMLKSLEDNHQVVFRYSLSDNPNGSLHDIAGIINRSGNVLGMMPHPEDYIDDCHGGADGAKLFKSLLHAVG